MIASGNGAIKDALYEAVERLQHHPYGNLSERLQTWLERDTEALRGIKERNNENIVSNRPCVRYG